jgi:dihydrofolate reductase
MEEVMFIIVATDINDGIGWDGTIPWYCPSDLQFFKRVTTTRVPGIASPNVVIMGRRTWESIPTRFRPLRDRVNIVITSQTMDQYPLPDGVYRAPDFCHAAAIAQCLSNGSRVFAIGGARVYDDALRSPWIEGVFHTVVSRDDNLDYRCDQRIDTSAWVDGEFDDVQLRAIGPVIEGRDADCRGQEVGSCITSLYIRRGGSTYRRLLTSVVAEYKALLSDARDVLQREERMIESMNLTEIRSLSPLDVTSFIHQNLISTPFPKTRIWNTALQKTGLVI